MIIARLNGSSAAVLNDLGVIDCSSDVTSCVVMVRGVCGAEL